MDSTLEKILDICIYLVELADLSVAIENSIKRAGMVGVFFIVGCLIGGRIGLLAGAALAGSLSVAFGLESKPVAKVIREEMTDLQRKQLACSVSPLLRGIDVTDSAVAGKRFTESYVGYGITEAIARYLQHNMGYRLC